ncbi:hypothetical protein DXG03_004365 [Asterophora parasitica]|uniref:RRM domain-containing protein n=1 Tax=Asterophora parasitica TaxID=117018 RepID=A0A9P7KFR6_9AGAR|nr:hypothetical protein DXG03_004365 [Asterophora parasitica]
MSSENPITSTTKKDKKSKRKSVGDATIPPTVELASKSTNVTKAADTAVKGRKKAKKGEVVEIEETVEEVVESKKSKKSKKGKNEDVAKVVENDVVEETAEAAKSSNLKKGSKVAPPIEEETLEEVVESKKSKKSKKVGKAGIAKSIEVSVPATAQGPIPSSISATSRASKSSKVDKTTKKSKKAPSPELEAVDGDEEAGSDEDEENLHLHGFSTDDDDSSDDDDAMDHEPSAFDVAKLPTIAKDDAIVKRKLEKAKRTPTDDRGVLFIGRIPHGFYEDQMRGYFTQFGTVTRVRLSRNKKTGRSKHYGFVEFDSSSVAQIVAETMDNYLLMGHILRCKVIPKDEVHPELWVGANRKWRAVPHDRVTRLEHNKPRTEDEQIRAAKRLIKRQNERKRKLADAGIKYDFEAVSYKKAKEVAA